MKTTKLFLVLIALCASLSTAQPMHERKMPKDLNLTETQQEQFDKITFDQQKKQIELRAKLDLLKLEMGRLMDADQLDRSAIEKKMNEIADQNVALKMNHLNAWSEKNKLLNVEQQKIWRSHLKQHVRAMQSGRNEMMMPSRSMKHKRMMTHPPMDRSMDEEHPRMERRIEKEIIKQ